MEEELGGKTNNLHKFNLSETSTQNWAGVQDTIDHHHTHHTHRSKYKVIRTKNVFLQNIIVTKCDLLQHILHKFSTASEKGRTLFFLEQNCNQHY